MTEPDFHAIDRALGPRKPDGGPAFPCWSEKDNQGMSLRDYFAAQALAVIPGDAAEPQSLAADAYRRSRPHERPAAG